VGLDAIGVRRSDWPPLVIRTVSEDARLVNGFVNETRRHCMYDVERGVMV